MVSRKERHFLRWMKKHRNEWLYLGQIEKCYGRYVDFLFLERLHKQGLIDQIEPIDFVPPNNDYEPPVYEYRINEYGIASLETQGRYIFSELRAWITAGIAVLAFLKSFFF